MAAARHLHLHNCEPTPLQREGLMRRAAIYRAWVAAGTVRRADAEAMLVADAKQIGCDIEVDNYLAVQPHPQGPVPVRRPVGAGPGQDGHGDGPMVMALATVRPWR